MESLPGMAVTGRGRKQGWGIEPGGSQLVPGQKPGAGGHRKGNTGTRDPNPTEMESWLRAGTVCCPLLDGAFSSDITKWSGLEL